MDWQDAIIVNLMFSPWDPEKESRETMEME